MGINYLFLFFLFISCVEQTSTPNEIDVRKENIASESSNNAVLQKPVDQDKCISISELSFSQTGKESMTYFEGSPFTGKGCSYHSSGKISTLTSYVDGRRAGIWEVYYDNGQLEKAGIVKDGKEHGSYQEYFRNGQLKYDYTYDRGAKVGVWKSWYEDGTPYTERNFNNDKLNGKVLVWDENGKLSKEYDYINGKVVNSIMHFKNEN